VHKHDFDELLHEHAGLLTRIASSYEADPSLRDDLLQDVALALWRALPAWRGEASLKTFVARIAHNRGVNHVVRRKRLPPVCVVSEALPDGASGPETRAQAHQERARLLRAVQALPTSLQQVVTLALEGFKQAEIAQTLGITDNNVAVRLNRARKALKTALGESE
jgi:RNA polymerase sigma-70 factor (ECF subfamily)